MVAFVIVKQQLNETIMLKSLWKKLTRDEKHKTSSSRKVGDEGEHNDTLESKKGALLEKIDASRSIGGDGDIKAPSYNEMDDMIKTHYPDFDDEVPDALEISDDDDEDSVEIRLKEEKYATKEDQDIAVFLSLAEQMSLKSLLHLLQGHVRSNAATIDQECLKQYAEFAEIENTYHEKSLELSKKPNKPLAKQKQFRFAEVTDNQVRVVVHEIESVKDMKELWWKPEEMQSIRSELIDAVAFYRKHRKRYCNAVEIIARGNDVQHIIETHMKYLTQDTYARGLESHCVRMLSENRQRTIQAVLYEQVECRVQNDSYEDTAESLRDASLVFSAMSTKFANKMGQCDEIDALKANMSKWDTGIATTTDSESGSNPSCNQRRRNRRVCEPPVGGFFDPRK